MGHVGDQIVAILTAIIGVAIVAVIVSNRSQSANVISSASNALAGAISTAVSPITGGAAAGGGFTTFSNQIGSTISGSPF
jgi:membrane DNA delivery protein